MDRIPEQLTVTPGYKVDMDTGEVLEPNAPAEGRRTRPLILTSGAVNKPPRELTAGDVVTAANAAREKAVWKQATSLIESYFPGPARELLSEANAKSSMARSGLSGGKASRAESVQTRSMAWFDWRNTVIDAAVGLIVQIRQRTTLDEAYQDTRLDEADLRSRVPGDDVISILNDYRSMERDGDVKAGPVRLDSVGPGGP